MSTEPTEPQSPASESATAEPIAETIAIEAPDRHECRGCGYVYNPYKGDPPHGIAPDTKFTDLPEDWRCPVCNAPQSRFSNLGPVGSTAGFKENLGYGFGVNTMTSEQKNLLIFGALALGFLFFMSLYTLQ
jgi:rubredoxin